MRFLVVDDSSTMRRIIINTLNKLGYQEIVEASNGREGIDKLGSADVDMVITDSNMPEMNGIEFIRALRGLDKTKETPILMVTTNAAKGDIVEALRAGVNNCIGTAYMARLLAEWLGLDEEEAFMYGLLHDIGKLVILKAAFDVRRQTGQAVPDDVLDATMAEQHANVGAHVLRRWRLPSMLDEPIVCHHDWTRATAAPRKAAVTYFANRLSHRYGFGCDADPVDLLSDPVCKELGIDQAWLDQTDKHAPGLVDVAKKILGWLEVRSWKCQVLSEVESGD